MQRLGVLVGIALLACDESVPVPANPACATQGIFGGVEEAAWVRLAPSQYGAIGLVEPSDQDALEVCTGTVIATDWVLTAEHCNVAEQLRFRSLHGDTQLFVGLQVSEVVTHPDLDLALLHIPDVGSFTVPIPIAEDDSFVAVGEPVQLAGVGLAENDLLGRLLFAVEPLTDVKPAFLEVNGFGRSGACAGDSGGPILVRDPQGRIVSVGVLSFGESSCLGFDVAVRLAPVVDWIDEVTQGSATPSAGTAPSDACEAIEREGFCAGDQVIFCEEGAQQVVTCSSEQLCGWSDEHDAFRCVPAADDPCQGVGSSGACQSDRALRCESGDLVSQPCNCACGRSSSDGRATCY